MNKKGKNKKDLNRRDFLKISGGLLGLAVISTPIVEAIRKIGPNNSKKKAVIKRTNQWNMIIDLKKCEGCVTIGQPPLCTNSCIIMHSVPEGQQWIEVFEEELPGGGSFFRPVPCLQCENAPCVKVCPVKATYHNEEGIVLINHERCIGCRMCMAACPYQRRFFNWGEPIIPAKAAFEIYSPDFPVPSPKGTVNKCMFCSHLLKEGKLPGCVTGCPMGALYIGEYNRDLASNGQEVVKLSKFLDERSAYRYKEELGTQPRVWYLPGIGEGFGLNPHDKNELKSLVWPERES